MAQLTIDELAMRCEYEPSLRDVFVEGLMDARVIRWFLKEFGSDAAVFEINDITVPAALVSKHGVSVGNRGRVIALAMELAERLSNSPAGVVVCVADRDCDPRVAMLSRCPFLLFTDFRDFEGYFLNGEVLAKFLALAADACPLDAQGLCSRLASPLVELGVIHIAKERLALGCDWLEGAVLDCCRRTEKGISVDGAQFLHRMLSAGRCYERRDEVNALIAQLQEQARGDDPRNWIRGHDFLRVLLWDLEPYLASALRRSLAALEQSLYAIIEIRFLEGMPLFKELVRRLV